MAEMVQEKSTGLKFAEEQLLRHGWEKGKGLGRSENGISEAIKVKIKCGKGGMGHKEGEQFSFHWWDHVFNKASSSLVVETGQSGVMVKKSDDSSDGLISAKKPRKAQQAKSMLYGCFVKSATLLSGELQPENTSDSDDSSSSEDEDKKLDLSSTTKLSDADLLNACGGRTAHKGARHGLTMSAKLARLEQQEQEFMNKYGKKKNHTAETSTSSTDCLNPAGHPDVKEKTKRKKSKRQEGPSENNIHEDKMTTQVFVSSNDTEDSKPKKRKDSNGVSVNDDIITEPKKKKKKNRKEKEAPEDGLNGERSIDVNEALTHTSEEQDAQLQMNDSIHKKKKKKKRSKAVAETADTDELGEDSTDTHCKQPQEGSIEYQTSDNVSRKKKKTAMENSTGVTVTEDTSNKAQIIDTQTEGQENKKRNKKKKRSKKEQEVVIENVQFEEPMPKKKKSKE